MNIQSIPRLLLLCVLLISFIYCSSLPIVNATSSQCRGPADTSSNAKRGVTTLSKSELDDIVESELLSVHQQEGLNAEDLEYLALLTNEHVQTLFRRRLRRAFRRVKRVVRRIGRAVGRAIRSIGNFIKKAFRRRAKEIIANSVANFNGFTGPNQQTLESRRPFIGGGAAAGNGGGGAQKIAVAASVLSASVLRRRRGLGRRLGRVFRRVAKVGRAIGRGVRRVTRVAKAVRSVRKSITRRVIGAARSVVRGARRVGKAAIRKIDEQSLKRRGRVGKFFSALSKASAKRGMRKKMEALENQEGPANGKPVNCVACRVDCLKAYSTLGGSMFTSCGQRYYYYGCQAVKQCLQTRTASDDEIEGMVGICAFRNGCKFKSEWNLVGENQIVTDRLVGRLRASGQNPE